MNKLSKQVETLEVEGVRLRKLLVEYKARVATFEEERDIADDKIEEVEQERDILAYENRSLAEFIKHNDNTLTDSDVGDIACGAPDVWDSFINESANHMLEQNKTIRKLRRKLTKIEGLQIEVDNLAEENKNFAEHLERKDYTFSEIDNIAKGWSVHKEYEDIYDDNYFEGYDEDDLLYDDYEMKDWQTKEGDFIPIYELEDAHLVAIIKLLRRKGATVPYEMLKEVHVRKLIVIKEN